jgi:hypothetical protein
MQQLRHPVARPRHLGWASRAVAAGFLASLAALIVLVAAYLFAYAVGSTNPNANLLSRSFWNLSHNPVTSLVASVQLLQAVGLHLIVGLCWALVYAAVIEPVVPGPGWRKGLLFAIVPCLVSLFIFLPLVGAGVFGLAVGAGPLAGLGAILLHAVYGVMLGETYALADGEGMWGGVDSPIAKTITLVERDMSLGLVLGAIIGALVSLTLAEIDLTSSGMGSLASTIVGGAAEGAIAGVVIGILVGIITSD